MARWKNKTERLTETTGVSIITGAKRGIVPRFTRTDRRPQGLCISSKRGLRVVVALLSVLISVVLSCTAEPGYRSPTVNGDAVIIDVSQLKDIKPEFFSLTLGDQRIDFFVVRVGTSVESYINACRKCYRHNMGFRVDDVYLVCRYCNVRYPLHSLKTGIGNCSPIPLKGELDGQWYHIRLEHIREASQYF
jgi:uncharacterized membrane protein